MAPASQKLIVVANRGPVTFARDGSGRRLARRGGGGLVTALGGLLSRREVTWVASAMSEEDRAVAAEAGGAAIEETSADGSRYRLRLVSHDAAAYDRFYNTFANPTLWFLQHYLWDPAVAPTFGPDLVAAWQDGYVRVNEAFAEAVCEELERDPDAAVFFHDYHLYVAPGLVRSRRPDATLFHFVHIPWPQPDYWRLLPEPIRRAIHEGLFSNDLVTFHTRRWLRNFLACCEELLGAVCDEETGVARCGGRELRATARPITVDPDEFEELARSDDVLARQRELRDTRPERLVLRVDRTDPSKNVVRGFQAFELFLEQHPELHGTVGMLALLDPSRQDIPEYARYLELIRSSATEVNARFGREGWTPIDLRIEDDFAQSIAAYKEYDVLLVNAIFDGLNLVAKEAPLVNERDGVLLLSENAGAHEELEGWAVTVNPFDLVGQAEAIHAALELPQSERRRRVEAIRAHVREHDLDAWLASLLADLESLAAYSPR
jgi:trehalose 6-phosphate synthase